MTLKELDELELKWKGPNAGKHPDWANGAARSGEPIDWAPIDGLTPYIQTWTAVVDGADPNQEETQAEGFRQCVRNASCDESKSSCYATVENEHVLYGCRPATGKIQRRSRENFRRSGCHGDAILREQVI